MTAINIDNEEERCMSELRKVAASAPVDMSEDKPDARHMAPSPVTSASTLTWDTDCDLDADWSDDDGWDVDDFLDLWEKEHACIEDDDGWLKEEKCMSFRMEGCEWFVSDDHLRLSRSIATVIRKRSDLKRASHGNEDDDTDREDEQDQEPARKKARVLTQLPVKQKQKSKTPLRPPSKKPTQADRFRDFLEEEERKGVIRLDRESGGSPIGVEGWEVADIGRWWEDAREWFEDDPGTWTESAFFMVLRRIGFRALNDAAPPASLGHDFGLKRTDVARHGYVFDSDVLQRYNKMLFNRHAACRARASPILAAIPCSPSRSSSAAEEVCSSPRWERETKPVVVGSVCVCGGQDRCGCCAGLLPRCETVKK